MRPVTGTTKKRLERRLIVGRLAERVGFEPPKQTILFNNLENKPPHLGHIWGKPTFPTFGGTMPLTPLHLAAGLPLRKRISLKAFILVNILIDLEPGLIMFFHMDSMGYNLHQGVHTIGGVTLAACATVTALFTNVKPKLKAILYGAFWGAYSHLLLDALVHHDVNPLGPFMQGNPLYLDAYHEVSLVCAAILCYYLARWVESLRIGEVGFRALKDGWQRFFSR